MQNAKLKCRRQNAKCRIKSQRQNAELKCNANANVELK